MVLQNAEHQLDQRKYTVELVLDVPENWSRQSASWPDSKKNRENKKVTSRAFRSLNCQKVSPCVTRPSRARVYQASLEKHPVEQVGYETAGGFAVTYALLPEKGWRSQGCS